MIDCAVAPYRLALVLRNHANQLALMSEWIVGICKAARLSGRTSFALQLCLEEAVTNIVVHGDGNARAREIVASIVRDAADVVLIIEDDGGPFDPTKVAAPHRGDTLDDVAVGGLGIRLMRQFASTVEYRRKDGRNQLRLNFAGACSGADLAPTAENG